MVFYIIDAFSNKPFGGNPAGVVFYENITKIEMQLTARELGFSETAFIKQEYPNTFNIRFFTPNSEVDLCGHASVASIKAALDMSLVNYNKPCYITTKAGMLEVHIENDSILLEQASPILEGIIDDIKTLSDIMGIHQNEVGDLKYNLLPSIASTGLKDIMFPVKTQKSLNDINPDFKRLAKYSDDKGVVGVHAFTLETTDFTACCRNFAPLYAIYEEAATGTSNGALTYYLYTNNVIKDFNLDYLFQQGVKMMRPSIITSRIINDNSIKILVGGPASILSKGELFL